MDLLMTSLTETWGTAGVGPFEVGWETFEAKRQHKEDLGHAARWTQLA